MSKFMEKIRGSLGRFFQGRYGLDSLNRFIFFGIVLTWLLTIFFPKQRAWSVLEILLSLAFLYRVLSKDLGKRRLENEKFLESIQPVRKSTAKWTRRFKQRKTTKYFKCPQCKAEYKAPKNLGKIEVTCKKCGHKFIQKT